MVIRCGRPAPKRLRQENHCEFMARLGFMVSPCLKRIHKVCIYKVCTSVSQQNTALKMVNSITLTLYPWVN